MAEFILGNPLRNLARNNSLLRGILWRLDFMLVWSCTRLFSLLPTDMASRLGYRVGGWIGPHLKAKSEIFRINFRTALPQSSEQDIERYVREAWGNAGRILAEYMHLESILTERDGERLEIHGEQAIVTTGKPARPVVIVTAHHSNWELVCSAMAKLNMPNCSLYSPPANPLLDRLLKDSRTALNCELLPRENSARLLMRALKNGRTAAMVMDRRVDDGKAVTFFGKDKPSTLLPAKLALKNHCDMIPVRVERLRDANFRVTFLTPITPGDPQADENAQALDMIRQVHGLFEQWIREKPGDWFCSKRIWPKTNKVWEGRTMNIEEFNDHAAKN